MSRAVTRTDKIMLLAKQTVDSEVVLPGDLPINVISDTEKSLGGFIVGNEATKVINPDNEEREPNHILLDISNNIPLLYPGENSSEYSKDLLDFTNFTNAENANAECPENSMRFNPNQKGNQKT